MSSHETASQTVRVKGLSCSRLMRTLLNLLPKISCVLLFFFFFFSLKLRIFNLDITFCLLPVNVCVGCVGKTHGMSLQRLSHTQMLR